MFLFNQKPDNGEVLMCMHTSTPTWLLYHSEDFFQSKKKLFKTCEGQAPTCPSKSYLNAPERFLSPRERANESSPFSNGFGFRVSSLPTSEWWIPFLAGPAVPPTGPREKRRDEDHLSKHYHLENPWETTESVRCHHKNAKYLQSGHILTAQTAITVWWAWISERKSNLR